MTDKDFEYLHVPELLKFDKGRLREEIMLWVEAEIEFFKRNELLRESAPAWHQPLEEVTIMFSDFTDLGQDFIKNLEVEKWLAAYDRKKAKNPHAKPDGRDLDKRLKRPGRYIR